MRLRERRFSIELSGAIVIGKTISHYKVLEKIGEGGMGEVYLAEDTSLERKVALKFLPEYLQVDDVAHKRFMREAKSAAAIDHPYICNIFSLHRQFSSVEEVRFVEKGCKTAGIGCIECKEILAKNINNVVVSLPSGVTIR